MKRTLLAVIFLHLVCSVFATGNQPLGARSGGMGNASVSISDAWAVHNNQAGLGFQKRSAIGITYLNSFMMKELGTRALAAVVPVRAGTFGLAVTNSGYSKFSASKIGLGFGKSFGEKIAAGLSLDYFYTAIDDELYGTKNAFVAEMGILAMPIKNLTVGAHIFNPSRARLADYNDERIPTIMRIGFDYKFSEKVFVAVETEKDIETKEMLKAGLEYRPVKEFYLRAGVSTNPSLSCFGIGAHLKQFRFDLSSSYHSALGFSPQVGIIYEFIKIVKTDTRVYK